MDKKILIGIAVLVVLGLGYVLMSGRNEAPPLPVDDSLIVSPTEVVSDAIVVELAEQNESGESGIARLEEMDGQVVVTLSMIGAPEGVEQPAHIHAGMCPDVGEVVYPLESPLDGQSTTTLDVTLSQLREQLPLGLNVHKSATEASVYVSCGDLVL